MQQLTGSPELKPSHRTLIYFPIIHNQADLGALSESVKAASLKEIGRSGWKRKQHLIENWWTEIEKNIEGLELQMDRVRIYQDGLPVCGREAAIVAELAATGSRNHALLLRLERSGAAVMGTESLELLLEEYELTKKILGSGQSGRAKRSDNARSSELLKKRDQFVAGRINESLGAGETGIVFMGLLHSLEPWLSDDIRVIYPLHRPMGCA